MLPEADAIVELQGAIEADPAYTLPYMDLANAYWQSGDRAETFEFLGRAIETFPETAMFRILLATYLQQDGQTDRALQIYQDARKLAPRDPRLLANLNLGLALILDAAGAFDDFLLADPGAAYAKQTLEQLLRSGALRPR